MWTVIKYKKKEYESLISDLKKKVDNKIIFYNPKIKYIKKIKNKDRILENFILGGYAFCFYEKFREKKFHSQLKFTKGLEYFLEGHIQNQKQIVDFIKLCKKNEDNTGSLKQDFFSILQGTKIKFLNGPFSNFIFDILEKRKKNIKSSLGSMTIIINNKSNYYYSPVY